MILAESSNLRGAFLPECVRNLFYALLRGVSLSISQSRTTKKRAAIISNRRPRKRGRKFARVKISLGEVESYGPTIPLVFPLCICNCIPTGVIYVNVFSITRVEAAKWPLFSFSSLAHTQTHTQERRSWRILAKVLA